MWLFAVAPVPVLAIDPALVVDPDLVLAIDPVLAVGPDLVLAIGLVPAVVLDLQIEKLMNLVAFRCFRNSP